MFFLQNSAEMLISFFHFIKHYRGMYSKEIKDSIDNPMFLEGLWEHTFVGDNLSGGYVELNEDGLEKYQEIVENIRNRKDDRLMQILAALRLIHDLYDKLAPKELLYFIYTSPKYREYTEKSDVYNQIVTENTKNAIEKKISKLLSSEAAR
ncbi:MAG: hypothetical protein L6408_00180 [Nanoarchaeota archaeon]|nr:hypothetical protein [Nanoarchaeota archaeon]